MGQPQGHHCKHYYELSNLILQIRLAYRRTNEKIINEASVATATRPCRSARKKSSVFKSHALLNNNNLSYLYDGQVLIKNAEILENFESTLENSVIVDTAKTAVQLTPDVAEAISDLWTREEALKRTWARRSECFIA